MVKAQSMVYQGWRLAGFCTTRMWCCMQAGLSDCRELYWLSSGDGLSVFFGLTFRAVLEYLLMPALLCPTHLYLVLFEIVED